MCPPCWSCASIRSASGEAGYFTASRQDGAKFTPCPAGRFGQARDREVTSGQGARQPERPEESLSVGWDDRHRHCEIALAVLFVVGGIAGAPHAGDFQQQLSRVGDGI